MLTIRWEQMKAFEKTFERRFIRDAMLALAQSRPEECERLGSAGLRRLVEKAVRKCGRYGISEEDLILRFVYLQIDRGEDFDYMPQSSWALPILRDTATDQHDKLDQLELESFTRATLEFIRMRHPETLEEYGERGVRDTIAEARLKCLRYRFDLRWDGFRLIRLMCALGSDFDVDDDYPWAAQILQDKSLNASDKIGRLEEAAARVSSVRDGG